MSQHVTKIPTPVPWEAKCWKKQFVDFVLLPTKIIWFLVPFSQLGMLV